MKSKILLLALSVAAFSSCSTSYKTGQTPDDLYYSPVQARDEYVQTDKDDDRQYRNNEDAYYEDQYLRMKVRDRYRWSEIDDPYYYSRRNNYTTYNCCCFGNPWTPSVYWNNYYNPYYKGNVIFNTRTIATYNKPRTFNLNTYNNNALTNSNYNNSKYISSGSNNNTYSSPRNKNSSKSNSGNVLRDVFKGSSNNNNSSGNSSNNNNSSGSSSSSGSSGSSSGGSAPVRRF